MSEKETKDRIIDSATELFGKYGKNGVSVSDIAQSAHANKALIFYYFGSKDELYRTVLKNLLSTFVESIQDKLKEAEPGLSAIETFVRIHIGLLQENKNMARLFIRELIFSEFEESSLMQKDVAEILKTLRYEMIQVLSNARNSGQIRQIDPVQTMVSIVSLDIFFFLAMPILKIINPYVDFEKFEASRVDHVVDLLMNGLKKPQE